MNRAAKIIMGFYLVSALGVSNIRAEIIAINLTAEITGLEDPCALLNGQLAAGDIITGSYTYNSDTPDTNPLSTVGDYWHYSAPYGIVLSAGGFVFQTDPDNVTFHVGIANNDYVGGLYDCYALRSFSNLLLSNDAPVDIIMFYLEDPSANALSSDALPTIAPVLEDWDIHYLTISGKTKAGTYHINAEITEIVPEPTTVLLLGFGGLVLMRKQRA